MLFCKIIYINKRGLLCANAGKKGIKMRISQNLVKKQKHPAARNAARIMKCADMGVASR